MLSAIIVLLAIVLLTAPLDLPQLLFAFFGAICYGSFQVALALNLRSKKEPPALCRGGTAPGKAAPPHAQKAALPRAGVAPPPPRAEPVVLPIAAPTFESKCFVGQVDELLARISPTPEGDRVVRELTRVAAATVRGLLPEAEVVGFASAGLRGGAAYGVAVPEVDIVASVSPTDLVRRLQGRLTKGSRRHGLSLSRLDGRKLQKSAIRLCTSSLVAAGFKFRRSSFRNSEPKVTLLAPASLGVCTMSVPVDFSVNNITPLYNVALVTECGQIEPRAKALILFVKRWAKDRGVCHASKGHLNPYAWSLLVIYFLQVGVVEEGPLLPPLEGFAASSGLLQERPKGAAAPVATPAPLGSAAVAAAAAAGSACSGRAKLRVAELFVEFVRFYTTVMDWREEAVCVRLGRRAPPCLSTKLHIICRADGGTEIAPTIEDPFDACQNLGACANEWSLGRLREELSRADGICTSGCTLEELLEPWRPPEAEAEKDVEEGAADMKEETGEMLESLRKLVDGLPQETGPVAN